MSGVNDKQNNINEQFTRVAENEYNLQNNDE